MVTTRELAIAASVIHASLDDYPLTLEELHWSLIGSQQTAAEVVSVHEGSDRLQRIIERRDGFFFTAGRSDLVDERRRREARSRAFLDRHALLLQLVCCLPFVRLVALCGPIAQLNLAAGGDLDFFIVTRAGHIWSTAAAVKGLSAPQQWANTAEPARSRLTRTVRTLVGLILSLPSPIIETGCCWLQAEGDTLVDVPPRQRRDDLFAIFPDLPWHCPTAEDPVQRVRQQAEAFRERARANIARQQASAARMRARVAHRKGR